MLHTAMFILLTSTSIGLPLASHTTADFEAFADTGMLIGSLHVTKDNRQLICFGSRNLAIVTLANGKVQQIECEPDSWAGGVVDKDSGVVWACSRTGRVFSLNPGETVAKHALNLDVKGAWRVCDWKDRLVVYCYDLRNNPFERGTIQIINKKDKTVSSFDAPHEEGVTSMVAIGDYLYTAGKKDKAIVVSRLQDKLSQLQKVTLSNDIGQLAWHNSDQLAICLKDGTIEIRNVKDMSLAHKYASLPGARGIRFSPDGSLLIVHSQYDVGMIELSGRKSGAFTKLNVARQRPLFAAIVVDRTVIIAVSDVLCRMALPDKKV